MKKLFIVLTIALVLTACGKGGNNPNPQDKPDITPVYTGEENEKANNWLIEVSDSKKGTYTIPGSGRSIDYTATLNLIAWKNGGDDIFGDYKGRWLINFDVDYAKLSDSDVQFTGNVLVDRLCNEMSFSISPYSIEEYGKIRKAVPGATAVEHLVKMDGMSAFIADWQSVKRENWLALKGGDILHKEDSSFADSEKIPVGINILTRQEEITVDIPTYSYVWKLGYFHGSITKNTDVKDPNELFNNILAANAEKRQSEAAGSNPGGSGSRNGSENGNSNGNENGSGIYTTDSEGRKGFDTDNDGKADTWYDEDGNMQSDVVKGNYMTDSEGHEGFDTDGDGKLDMWFDEEGNMNTDFNKDGKWEVTEITGSDDGTVID